MIFLNVIVLVLELLYYSLFLKFCRKDGKLSRYILLFVIFTIISLFMNKKDLISYGIIIFLMLYGLKYIVRTKISLFDMVIILMMFMFKIILEIPSYYLLSFFFNGIVSTILFQIMKLVLVIINKNNINKLFRILKAKWDNNSFNLRYIFTIIVYGYVIATSMFLIFR